MNDPKLETLGLVWILWSAFTTLIGLAVAALAMGMGGLFSMVPDQTTGEPSPLVGLFFGGFGLVFGLVFVAMGAFGVIMGRSLRRGARWAIVAACILGFLQITNFPLGTVLGVWTLVVGIPALQQKR